MYPETTETKWFLSISDDHKLGLGAADLGVTLQFWFIFSSRYLFSFEYLLFFFFSFCESLLVLTLFFFFSQRNGCTKMERMGDSK